MDNSGQLTFSDDPLLNRSNEVYYHIESGEFKQAVKKLDELMSIDPDYPGLIEAYRTSKFWLNRFDEYQELGEGKESADFLMKQWQVFEEYSENKSITSSAAYRSAMKYIFFRASEHYKLAFSKQEDTANNFDFLLNLGDCFLRLDEYKYAIDTLEYARSSYKINAKLLSLLGEAHFHTGDIPKSLLYFREAFFIDPAEVDLTRIKAKPILELIKIVKNEKKGVRDIREWVPVYGFLTDILYVRRNLSRSAVDSIESDIYNLEVNFQKMSRDQLAETNIVPRLINNYLWLLDYYEFNNYSFENITQIRDRLMIIDKNMFLEYFKRRKS